MVLADTITIDEIILPSNNHPSENTSREAAGSRQLSRKLARGVKNHIPIYSSLKRNDAAVRNALEAVNSKAECGHISGADLWEAEFSAGVNNRRTRKALRNIVEENYTIDGPIKSAHEIDHVPGLLGKFQRGLNNTLDVTGLDNVLGRLEIYQGVDKGDTFRRNYATVSGETSAFFSGSLLATGGAMIAGLYAGGTAVQGISEATGSDAISDVFGYTLAGGMLAVGLLTGDVLSGARGTGMIANQYAAKKSRGDTSTTLGKVSTILKPALMLSTIGAVGFGMAGCDYDASASETGDGTGDGSPGDTDYGETPEGDTLFREMTGKNSDPLWALLAEADKNNDGIITNHEADDFLKNSPARRLAETRYSSIGDFSDFDSEQGLSVADAKAYMGSFHNMADLSPNEPLWGLMADADIDNNGIVTEKEINKFLEGRSDAEHLRARYNHLGDFRLSDDAKGVSIADTQAFLDDYHKAYQNNFGNHQRTFHNVGNLNLIDIDNDGIDDYLHFSLDNTDAKTAEVLKRLSQDESIGYLPEGSDAVVRIFRHGDGTPIAIADVGENGLADEMTLREGLKMSERDIINGISSGNLVAEASLIDRQGTYPELGETDCYNDDTVHIFDRKGSWDHRQPTEVVRLPPKPEPEPIVSGPSEPLPKSDITYTTDRGWEGLEGRHPADSLEGKTMVLHSGDMVGVGPSEEAAANGYDTQTIVEHSDGEEVYGKKTLGTKARNIFTPKENEWYRYKIAEHQDGTHGEPVVLNGNNGICGNESGHPDEVRFKHVDHKIEGGYRPLGKGHSMLGGVEVSEGENNYNLHTNVWHETDGSPKVVDRHDQRVEVDPMRNSTAAAAGAVVGSAATAGAYEALGPAEGATVKVIEQGMKGGQHGGQGF